MQPDQCMPNGALVDRLIAGTKEPTMTVARHRRLTKLAYKTKKFIDKHGGVQQHESCKFGQMMAELINLK
jgi:hypothetical protein